MSSTSHDQSLHERVTLLRRLQKCVSSKLHPTLSIFTKFLSQLILLLICANYHPSWLFVLTHCGRVTQICVFNTVKLGTSASSPQCHSTRGNVSRRIPPSSTSRVFGEYFLKISVHKNSQRICYKFLKKHSINLINPQATIVIYIYIYIYMTLVA